MSKTYNKVSQKTRGTVGAASVRAMALAFDVGRYVKLR